MHTVGVFGDCAPRAIVAAVEDRNNAARTHSEDEPSENKIIQHTLSRRSLLCDSHGVENIRSRTLRRVKNTSCDKTVCLLFLPTAELRSRRRADCVSDDSVSSPNSRRWSSSALYLYVCMPSRSSSLKNLMVATLICVVSLSIMASKIGTAAAVSTQSCKPSALIFLHGLGDTPAGYVF